MLRADPPTVTHGLLVKLSIAQEKVNAENEKVAGIVTELRKAGVSWAIIGKRLGTTKQAAQQRFGRLGCAPLEGQE